MYPSGAAELHPAAEFLKDCATNGCPVDTGQAWAQETIIQAVERGPHISAMEPDAMMAFRTEVAEKIEKGQAKIVRWDDIKHNIPTELKISPISQIPHKSRAYRTILDLSYKHKTKDGIKTASVNASTTPTAPSQALTQMGSVLP